MSFLLQDNTKILKGNEKNMKKTWDCVHCADIEKLEGTIQYVRRMFISDKKLTQYLHKNWLRLQEQLSLVLTVLVIKTRYTTCTGTWFLTLLNTYWIERKNTFDPEVLMAEDIVFLYRAK